MAFAATEAISGVETENNRVLATGMRMELNPIYSYFSSRISLAIDRCKQGEIRSRQLQMELDEIVLERLFSKKLEQ